MSGIEWRRLGRVFVAEGQRPWMQSHTACPVAMHRGGDRFRIYFATRDGRSHPSIGYLEIDLMDPGTVLALSEAPVLTRGAPGMFDDNGVYPGSLVEDRGKTLLYYMGRSNGEPPLYGMAIGLAEAVDEGEVFRRLSPAPVLDRSIHDPWMVSTPCVQREGALWRLWYLSGLGWDLDAGNSFYHIKYAQSDDGVIWRRDGQVAIEFGKGESNIASPTVVKGEHGYKMWYCTLVDGAYRIGYAVSREGVFWTRCDDKGGLKPSDEGWDGLSVAYPHAFRHRGMIYLIYCGNEFGRGGLGLAVAREL